MGDKLGHDATKDFNTEGEGSDIEWKDVAGQNRALDSHTNDNGLVRVDSLAGISLNDFGNISLMRMASMISLAFKPAMLRAFLQGLMVCGM